MYKRIKRLALLNFALLTMLSLPIWLYLGDKCTEGFSSFYRAMTYDYTGQVRGRVLSNTTAKTCRGRWGLTLKRMIAYTYNIDGQTYRADIIHNGGIVPEDDTTFSQLKPGDEVIVYYSKNRPSEAVLDLGHLLPGLAFYFSGAILMSLITGSLMLRW